MSVVPDGVTHENLVPAEGLVRLRTLRADPFLVLLPPLLRLLQESLAELDPLRGIVLVLRRHAAVRPRADVDLMHPVPVRLVGDLLLALEALCIRLRDLRPRRVEDIPVVLLAQPPARGHEGH